MKKTILVTALFAMLTGCASGVDAAKRLADCVIDGNVNNNCTFSTLEGDPDIKTESSIRATDK